MRPVLDDNGYLDEAAHSNIVALTSLETNGTTQMFFRANLLQLALHAYGEDDLLERVRIGITRAQVEQIGRRSAELELTGDPARSDGSGFPADKALATAAVEVLEGAARPLARRRRRPGSAATGPHC
jgi:hypothetical protein